MADESTSTPQVPVQTAVDAPFASGADRLPPLAAPTDGVHKQLYQFLWSGAAVLFGCILPLQTHARGFDANSYNPSLTGPIGFQTVGGSLTAFVAIVFLAAQLHGLRTHRVLFKPLFLMMGVTVWAWMNVLPAFRAAPTLPCKGFPHETKTVGDALLTLDLRWMGSFLEHIGPGNFFILVGSTIPVLIFLSAFLAVIVPKKKNDLSDSGHSEEGAGKGRKRR